ncbi:hypothetical protein [Actinocatenispora rupis]|uniref:Mce-associated membrane protein n=1 Tax=Actinocatenispora rupis TaxID=519421 RepID=A0A8J3NCB5_9ACTN|nr:hypothetical protein [Actinocatenispora rupis]GID11572.1 hypothetical protein Aru02nite_24610 [Actinocatenispora rupis]
MARYKPRGLRTQSPSKPGAARRPAGTTKRTRPAPPADNPDTDTQVPVTAAQPVNTGTPAQDTEPAQNTEPAKDAEPAEDPGTTPDADEVRETDDAGDIDAGQGTDDAPDRDEQVPADDDSKAVKADDTDTASDRTEASGTKTRRPSPRPRRTRKAAGERSTVETDGASGGRKPSPRPRRTEEAATPVASSRPKVKAPARPTGTRRPATGNKPDGTKKPARRGGKRAAAQRRRLARRLAGLHVLVVVLAVLAVLTVPAAVYALVASYRADQTKQAESDATSVAQAAAPAILSYDYRTFDASVSRGKRYTGGDFAKQYAKSTSGLKASATKVRAIVTARVAATSVVSSSSDQVVLLMYVDQYRKNVNIDGQKVDQNRVLLTMTRQNGSWKVTKVTAI